MIGKYAELLKQKYQNSAHAQKLNHKDFMEGFCAGCALVATADGTAGDDEYQLFGELIDSQDALNVFKRADLENLFDTYVKKCKFNKREVWKQYEEVPEDLKPNVVDMMLGMAGAEGGLHPKERDTILDAIKRGRLNAREWADQLGE